MRQPDGGYVVSRDQYDAVLFDLDGVITNTAKLHAACWKQMFDRLYLDGKPRFDGVRDFLASRGIKLPGGLSSGVHAGSTRSDAADRSRIGVLAEINDNILTNRL